MRTSVDRMPTRAFQTVIALIAIGWLGVTIWLATHESTQRAILGRYSIGYFALLACLFGVAALLALAQVGVVCRHLHALRWRLGSTAVAILLSLGVLELAVRALDPLGISYLAASTEYHLAKIPDPDLVFKHRPNLDATFGGIPVTTNEMGLRDRPVGPKASDELRVLFLGDSVTFGYGVPVEETFCRRSEQLLADLTGRNVRTINSGVGGYNTVQEAAFLLRDGDELAPDLVVLVFVTNDVETNDAPFDPGVSISVEGKSPPEILRILLGKSWLYRLVWFVRTVRDDAPRGPAPGSRGWVEALHAVRRISDYCHERGIPLSVVFWHGPRSGGTEAEIHNRLTRLAKEKRFSLADSTSWWGSRAWTELTNSIVDTHPNAIGHEITAERIVEGLVRDGLVRPLGK